MRGNIFCKFTFILFLLSLLGAFSFFSFSYHDIGIAWDSVHYLVSADNFYQGNGFATTLLYWQESGSMKPLTHFPPLYPFLIACLMHLGLSPFNAGYLLLFILFTSNLFLVSFLIYKITQSRIASLLTFSILITSREFIGLHYALLSDSLFILFLLLFYYLFIGFIRNNRFSYLLGLSFFASCACLTRYPGVALVVSGFICIWMVTRGLSWEKIKTSLFFLLVSILPLLIWCYRGYILSVNPVDRAFIMSDASVVYKKIFDGFVTVLLWLMPNQPLLWLKKGLAIFVVLDVLCIFYFILIKKTILKAINGDTVSKYVNLFFIIFIFIFLVLIFMLLVFFDPELQFQDRIIAPIYVAGLFLVISWLAILFRNNFFNNPIFKICIFLLLGIYCINCFYDIGRFRKDPSGFVQNGFCLPQWNDSHWDNSELIKFLSKQKEIVHIFSNAEDLVYFKTGKPAYNVLRKEDIGKINQFVGKVKALYGVVVYFNVVGRVNYVSKEVLLGGYNNHILFSDHDGIVFLFE